MPAVKLTDAEARKLAPGVYTDTGLTLRGATLQFTVSPNGKRVFDLLYRDASGKRCRLGAKNFGPSKGVFGPGALTVPQARRIAEEAWKGLCAGADPAADRRADKETGTVHDVAEAYCIAKLAEDPEGYSIQKYVAQVRRILTGDPFASMLARKITPKDVEAFLQRRQKAAKATPQSKGGDHAVDRARSQLSAAFSRAGITPNPFDKPKERSNTKASRVARSKSSQKDDMSVDEIAFRCGVFWQEIQGDNHSQDARDLLLACLMLGNRKSEVYHMRKDQIDRARKVWIIPPEQIGNKWGVTDTVPLTAAVWAMLERRLEAVPGPLVFPSVSSRRQGKPYCESYLNRIVSASKDGTAICQRHKFTSTVHDIRRLAASWCRTQPLHYWAAPFILNHASKRGGKNDAVYIRGDVTESLRSAMQAFENWVIAQAEGQKSNVVKFSEAS